MAVYTDNGTNTPNGSHLEFTYTFPTIKTDGSDVKVALNNQTQATNKYTVTTTSPTKITFNNTSPDSTLQESTGAPKTGVTVRVYRDTNVDAAEAVYAAGSSIRAGDLNNNQDQVLFALQEEQQLKIVSEDIGTGVINSDHIKDGTIVNADINDSAAIAQSKLSLDAELTELATMSSGTASALADLTQTEVQILDGATVTKDELNILDGVTATKDELNYTDGVTSNIQTQLDAKVPAGADGGVDIGDSSTIRIGDGDDLLLYHDASTGHSYIEEDGTNELKIASTPQIGIINKDRTVTAATFNTNGGGVNLYHNNSKKFETTGIGATVTGKTTTTTLNIGGTDITANGTELNYVDGVTSNVQTQLDAKQASDAELTELATMHTDTASALADLTQAEVQILDGATVSTTELNKLDGVTASATDLNIVASMTKQTTISDQDTSYPTSGAVVDYVAAQIAPIGGLEVIATDAAFPNDQPSSGVVISIADAGGLVVNGSGQSTTGRTVGASTVTINGINSSFHSTTIDAGIGMLVTSTGSGHIYDYHKTVIKESDVAQISDDINDFNSRYRIAGSAPGSDNDEGDLYFDTGTNKMYVYDGSSWGEVTSTGDFKYLVPCAFNTGTGNAAVFDGSISKYDLRENSTSGSLASVTNAAQLMVSVNGVVQKPNTGTSIGSNDGFCLVDGHTIEFGANLPSSSEVFVVQSGSALSINVVGDGTVTEAKFNANAPTNGHVLTADDTAAGGFKWATTEASSITTQGDILYRGASENERLAAGTSGYYLKTQGSGANPVWAAVSQYSTPLTTRGDILFRDASGDQRLAKGTAGQYLKIGANDPEWADVVGAVADGCIFENDQTISNNYTIASGKGAHSVGPITVNATVTVNGNWVVS